MRKNPIFYKKYLHDDRLTGKTFVSISFSTVDASPETYDKKTNRNEENEVLNKVLYIISKFYKKNPNYIYMYGDPNDDAKIRVYEFMIMKCFPGSTIICDYTSGFPSTNIGYYIIPPKYFL
jgi:hypothetical protein